ncbi:MAG: menaquinone-dependent protoporphyrinogen oxidase [Eubacteriaceae bacterium]|jgi:menaquinone-dependent protoporphyrinogen oxidase|nr:menaquinone-dependent protoporphyrinogen oxidase [Eubacteriaceae bacterium]MDK2935856.1 menaquinone-dependent protoporphyrinogen oxidase [Eubacteriaceae bacterium]
MKTLILYASNCGYTEDCVQKLGKLLSGEIAILNIDKQVPLDLSAYDTVLIGGSIYMGQIQKKIKAFCSSHEKELQEKNLGLFISCATADKDLEAIESFYKNAFPEALLNHAGCIQNFGGELRMDKMKFSHRLIAKMMMKSAKEDQPPVRPLPESVKKMAIAINQLAI